MNAEAFTVRTDGETLKQLDELASQLDRSRNYLVNQAIKEFLDLQSWQIAKIEEGIAAADRGDVVPHDQVFAELRRKYGIEASESSE
jgi:predicted transcriptional regulator